ncbi:J domain-containing protein, partial [bacterium]|nr:J domain-containing protein [bacterium]
MTRKNNYYRILGLSRLANLDDIRKAYRRKVKVHHPDKSHVGKESKQFHLIQEAYEVLSNSDSKQEYDSLINWIGFKENDVVFEKYVLKEFIYNETLSCIWNAV